MASSNATTVEDYLAELPTDRREIISKIRKVILDNIPTGFNEVMNWGMICYEIPLSTFKDTYNKKPLMNIALAAQKKYNSLYLMSIYNEEDSLEYLKKGFVDNGLNLNMGKSCIRFIKTEDLPLDVIAYLVSKITVDDFIKSYKNIK